MIQFIYMCLVAVDVGVTVARHGEPRKGSYNAWVCVGFHAFILGLLWWGGFFGR